MRGPIPTARLCVAWILLLCSAALQAAQTPEILVYSNSFVLPGKLTRLSELAADQGYRLQPVNIDQADAVDGARWQGVQLLILDSPRPADRMALHAYLGDALQQASVAWIQVGGGAPAWGNIPEQTARRLIDYYQHGGEPNLRGFFQYWQQVQSGRADERAAALQVLPASGFYHPGAKLPFARLQDYLDWHAQQWPALRDRPRVAFAIHRGALVDMQTQVIDALIQGSEQRGLLPLAFWFDDEDDHVLQHLLRPAGIDALVNMQHLRNGEARREDFLALDVPVLQAFTWREGTAQQWRQASSGISSRTAATLLSIPETWGLSDPLVIAALEQGEPVPIAEQLQALLDKLQRLSRLRHTPAAEKELALMFWNHPQGERNVAASHLNLPRSLERLTAALAETGYRVPEMAEPELIDAMQAMLGGYYRPETLETLYRQGLAVGLPLTVYQQAFAGLPEQVRAEIEQRWGAAEQHWALRSLDGQAHFILPALQIGALLLMPQPPRAGKPGEAYHDTAVPVDHVYLAAYAYLRQQAKVDALIHFGTHGTQEWLPGKDRGLSTGDYPFLMLGDLPVFYPYIQDNVGEALQARRRGRAVTISHQTPVFAPAGLYAELQDLHQLLHEYQHLDQGAVRERTAQQIIDLVLSTHLDVDLGWDEARIRQAFEVFLGELHDQLHNLAGAAMPLGLHTFGEPAPVAQRLSTLMQQLGRPYYQALGITEPDELFAGDFASLQQSLPYRTLQKAMTEPGEQDAPALKAYLQLARERDRRLAAPGELEALLHGLAGGFIQAGPGGDPIRNPDVPSGRNLYGFEADKLPTRAAYEAGEEALQQLIEAYRHEHDGAYPRKLAFSLWSSEALRHAGVLESQVLHAAGLQPEWNEAGRLVALHVIDSQHLKRPRIDVVLQVTSVYRDQFDGFMRMLAQALAELAASDAVDNPVASHTALLRQRLIDQGIAEDEAQQLAGLRIFSNAPGDYGSGVSALANDSTAWEGEGALGQQYLERLQYGYGAGHWGVRLAQVNLFAEQLKGVEAAVMARSSQLNGVLSTDHPFEYLGGLAAAVREVDGRNPQLYIADLREQRPRTTSAASFLANELRSRYLNPQWITHMQAEGYAGTLEMLDLANNLFGWQATAPQTVRPEQWQALHDTFVRDQRELDLAAWFEQHNPAAQAQFIERLLEAVRKDYWPADEQTRRELVERWQQLHDRHSLPAAAPLTADFIRTLQAATAAQGAAAGFGLNASASPLSGSVPEPGQTVSGQLMQEVAAVTPEAPSTLLFLLVSALLACIGLGAWLQQRQPVYLPVDDL